MSKYVTWVNRLFKGNYTNWPNRGPLIKGQNFQTLQSKNLTKEKLYKAKSPNDTGPATQLPLQITHKGLMRDDN